jgi:hypothetical protein
MKSFFYDLPKRKDEDDDRERVKYGKRRKNSLNRCWNSLKWICMGNAFETLQLKRQTVQSKPKRSKIPHFIGLKLSVQFYIYSENWLTHGEKHRKSDQTLIRTDEEEAKWITYRTFERLDACAIHSDICQEDTVCTNWSGRPFWLKTVNRTWHLQSDSLATKKQKRKPSQTIRAIEWHWQPDRHTIQGEIKSKECKTMTVDWAKL